MDYSTPFQSDLPSSAYVAGSGYADLYRVIGGASQTQRAIRESRLRRLIDSAKVNATLRSIGGVANMIKFSDMSSRADGETYDAAGSLRSGRIAWQTSEAAGTAPVILVGAEDLAWNTTAATVACFKLLTIEVRQTLGVQPSEVPEVTHRLVSVSEAFARWEDGGHDTYHVLAHELVFGYLMTETKHALERFQHADALDAIGELSKTLGRVAEGDREVAPFYLNLENGSMLCDHPERYLGVGHIRDAFMALRRPRPLVTTISALDMLRLQGARICLICSGDSLLDLEQALSVHHQLAANRQAGRIDWPFEYVLLNSSINEQFMQALSGEASADAILKRDIFSDQPHALVLFDRQNDHLVSFLRSGVAMGERSGARLATVLSTRSVSEDRNPWGLSTEDLKRVFAGEGKVVGQSAAQPLMDISATISGTVADAMKESGAMSDAVKNSLDAQVAHFGWQARKLTGELAG